MQKYSFQKKSAADDRGFYIILAICLAAIVVSGYVLFTVPANGKAQQTQASADSGVYVPTVQPIETEDVKPSEDEPVQPSVTKEEAPAPKAEPRAAVPEKAVWTRPVKSEVTIPFSGDELLYQPTFGDWRVHRGTDYAGNVGDRVYAITSGTVKKVWTDDLNGRCITIAHADGITATYMGLMEKVKVKEGDTVKSGQQIGAIGETNVSETAQGAHLHLEAMKGDAYIDVESLFNSKPEE